MARDEMMDVLAETLDSIHALVMDGDVPRQSTDAEQAQRAQVAQAYALAAVAGEINLLRQELIELRVALLRGPR